MVNGSFRCYGSTQHIKNKFGQGFEIELKIKLPTEEEIREKINEYHFAEGTFSIIILF
jgi:ATP-binding cassette, subfamily A (ABC1), member 3